VIEEGGKEGGRKLPQTLKKEEQESTLSSDLDAGKRKGRLGQYILKKGERGGLLNTLHTRRSFAALFFFATVGGLNPTVRKKKKT